MRWGWRHLVLRDEEAMAVLDLIAVLASVGTTTDEILGEIADFDPAREEGRPWIRQRLRRLADRYRSADR